MFRYLLDLIFPPLCLACQEVLITGEPLLCTYCLATLPQVGAPLYQEEVEEKFLGNTAIVAGAALFHFTKLGPVQRMIHAMKYRHRPSSLRKLGYYYGLLWQRISKEKLDAIVPIPLHLRRLEQRGYNQSEALALGIAKALKVPCKPHWLTRSLDTETQTKKSREERMRNVQGAFHVPVTQRCNVADKHILLVDDLVTTGATLRAAATALTASGMKELSIATLAVAY